MIAAYLRLLRFHQWIKNLLLYFPLVLGGGLFHPGAAVKGLLPFLAFGLASSTSYVFNDLCDLEADRLHPVKRSRPLAAGRVTKPAGVLTLLALLAGAFLAAGQVSQLFVLFLLGYLLVSVSYSLYLKSLPIVDIFCISTGFVLRLYAGGEAFQIVISEWLFLSVFLLSLFLSIGKRYSELRGLGERAGAHRQVLTGYPPGFLEKAMVLSGGAVLVTYAIYAVSRPFLVYTVPLCTFGLLRYMARVYAGGSGDPTSALFRDGLLLATSALWAMLVGLSIYL